MKATERYKEILKAVKGMVKEGKEITSDNLKNWIGTHCHAPFFSRNRAQAWLRRMVKDGLIKVKAREGLGGRIIYELVTSVTSTLENT